ncbi:MAG: phosphomethylpyrimidine synthase ThiC [Endomicrobium sp.]|jgi:phosphomethylpyrimidine synthase|uniref:phosphomethylpyrimidine synthase ThiC n=1 Tax=Candidatus Endomicrobiellum cubanum TaxID=3242325 RepID=UPI002837768E|nr:phosphomethylpyrimidine synthase ThiC [Endomicrobium sp.]
MTLIELVQGKKESDLIKKVAQIESLSEEFIREGVAAGTIVIPRNINRNVKKIVGIGAGLKTKVNANIGTSPEHINITEELTKLDIAVKAGADAVMDLSTGGNLTQIRKEILAASPVQVGTVPIYEAACRTVAKGKKISQLDGDLLFDVIEEQAEQGVDFITVHCGINKSTVEILNRQGRLAGVVSRGGSFIVKCINATGKENPLYEQYDRLLAIAKKYDITLSLGDGFRAGCIQDASDGPQIAELSVLGELVLKTRQVGVQSMIEGPGHVPLNQIETNVILAKRMGHNAPLYFLGPLVTDIAPGYDHITSAIGGALAASYGVDFICYVTPAEHLRLPNIEDVHEGVISAKIAGHAADIVKGVKGAKECDNEMSKWRKARNWKKQKEFCLDPEKFTKERAKLPPRQEDVCTMCGEFCSMRDE